MATNNCIQWTSALTFPSNVFPAPLSFAWNNLQFNMTSLLIQFSAGFSVPTSATAIPMGGITTPRYAGFWNLDPTNYITIQNGSGGSEFIRLLGAGAGAGPYGDACILPLGPAVVPYAIANTSPCLMAYFIASL